MMALENIDATIAYTSPGGQTFYLAGPMAPTLGAQNGLALQEIRGVQAPIHHLVSQGARQHGDTWTDAVYDAAEVDMVLEASGVTATDVRKVTRAWIDSWSPHKLGKLSWFTPDSGEWWMDVRQMKNVPDALQSVRGKRQTFTWTAVNNDAFWKSFDSVGQFLVSYENHIDDFERPDDPTLGSDWDEIYSDVAPGAAGTWGIKDGCARWYKSGHIGRTVIARYKAHPTATDNQVVTMTFKGSAGWGVPFVEQGAFNDLWGRLDATCQNGIRVRVANNFVTLSRFIGGVEKVFRSYPLLYPPYHGEAWTLICGTDNSPREFIVHRHGYEVARWTETGSVVSNMGPSYRWTGFGAHAGGGNLGVQVGPALIMHFAMADNLKVTQSGHISLTNRGDQDGWPRFLCYGPGVFKFGNGPDAPTSITFGPLQEGQVVMITTLPRLRSVVDLSPLQPAQKLSQFQKLMKDLISFSTNYNVPPLLQQFESFFGILPPQGNLYSMLDGRFSIPIPPKPEEGPPVTSHISVSIDEASASSKVVAAVTPLKTWPE